jgi:hypothetical protein
VRCHCKLTGHQIPRHRRNPKTRSTAVDPLLPSPQSTPYFRSRDSVKTLLPVLWGSGAIECSVLSFDDAVEWRSFKWLRTAYVGRLRPSNDKGPLPASRHGNLFSSKSPSNLGLVATSSSPRNSQHLQGLSTCSMTGPVPVKDRWVAAGLRQEQRMISLSPGLAGETGDLWRLKVDAETEWYSVRSSPVRSYRCCLSRSPFSR